MRMWTRFYLLIGIPFLAVLKLEAAPMSSPAVIEAAGPAGPLSGTLLGPSDPAAPVVLIVPGSGPTDRDGNNPLGVRASSYRLIAEGLAASGIRSVRIDKRGMLASRGAVADANAATIEDYAADARAWAQFAARRAGAKCAWLVGHSEGGLVELTAAQKPAGICGLILVATPGRPLGEVMRAQIHANPANAPIQDQADAAITALEAGKPVDPATLHPALAPLFRRRPLGKGKFTNRAGATGLPGSAGKTGCADLGLWSERKL